MRLALAMLPWVIVLFFFGVVRVQSQSLSFYQLNFLYDGTPTYNSEWGAADLTFTGNANTLFFNLTVDTSWVIQNMPVLTIRNEGEVQTQRFWFPIGVSGIAVTNLYYGYSLTSDFAEKPAANQISPVSPDTVNIFTGFTGNSPGGGGPGPAFNLKGGVPVGPPRKHKNFPNQESPKNFCVPTGISNSMQWLNGENDLGIDPANMEISALGNALHTTTNFGTEKNNIYYTKKKYCRDNKIPITTHQAKGYQIADVLDEIAAGQDVEMMIDWKGQGGKGHCVVVTGGTPLGDDRYHLVISHDKDQNKNPGGCVDENTVYDKKKKNWEGALSNADGESGSILFLIECPDKKFKQQDPKIPGGKVHKFIPEVKSEFNHRQTQTKNLVVSGYSNDTPAPPLGNMMIVNFSCNAIMDISLDTGNAFQNFSLNCDMTVLYYHELDSSGSEYYDTEILHMNLTGGNLPPGVMLRESPDSISSGFMKIEPIPEGVRVESFFDVFFEISLDGGMTWLRDENVSTVLYADGPDVLEDIFLQNLTVKTGETDCFDATNTITLAGGGTIFEVSDGGNVTLIAGNSIVCKPESRVFPGGYLHGYIASSGPWCNSGNVPPAVHAMESEARRNEMPPERMIYRQPFFIVYPNPTPGKFTLEFSETDNPDQVYIEIYSIRGENVVKESFSGQRKRDYTLDMKPAGVYILRVIRSDEAKVVKIIKN
jgi:hypothetical protein